jgi:hypothetical protein
LFFSNAHELFKVSYKATRNGKISLDQLTIEMKEPRTNFRSLLNPNCPALWQEALLQVWLREEPHQGPSDGRPPPHQGPSGGVWLEAQATAVPFKFMRVDYSPQTKILPCSVYQAVYIVPITEYVHTERQLPISGIHSSMMGKSALAGEGGGCSRTP